MAEYDDIKPTQPIFPPRRLDRDQKPKRPPRKETESDEASERRRRRDGHKGQNVDDYA